VDVSKRRLDAHVEPHGAFESFVNDATGIAELAAFCRRNGVELVVMEASGGYERTAFLLLWEAGIVCGLTNPRSVRRYAEAMGVLEKTDRLDARIIARFAIAKDLKPNTPPTPGQQRLTALVARLCQITDDLVVQKQRRSSAMNPEMVASIDEVIALLKRQTRTLEDEIAALIDDDPLWARLDKALRTKGVADRAVARLLAQLPEIGIYSNKAIVKLAGLAPLAHDSGARPASATSAAAAPASARSCSWSRISPAATIRAWLPSTRNSPRPEKKKWSSASPWLASFSSASTHELAKHVKSMHSQLDNPDSRSPLVGEGTATNSALAARMVGPIIYVGVSPANFAASLVCSYSRLM
jgi:transposase